ncbi:hypothetical protein DFH09DRAFT_1282972 [Mycena vulgaris]|nr:hypothetical protein DFH09DRAFT_1282972 [Mycena vulgaris]
MQTEQGGSTAFLMGSRSWHAIMRDVLYITQCLLGDSVAMYRCWILWDRNFRVILFPGALLTASIVSGSIACQRQAHNPSGSVLDPAIWDWLAVFYALGLGQNTITTSLMAFRLWIVDRRSMAYNVGRSRSQFYYSTMLLLVESAALYFALQIIVLVAFLTKSNIQLILLGSIPPIIGNTFTLITIRVAFRSKQCVDGTTQTQSNGNLNMRDFGIAIEITETINISRDSVSEESSEKNWENDSSV